MIRRGIPAVVAAFLLLAPAAGHAALSAYSQNFETLVQAAPTALSADGWVVFGNVFDPTHTFLLYGYGTFPAPNPGGGFSAIDAGQGGPLQGLQQLSIYSDYNNIDHAAGRQIESNVFHEQTIVATDAGKRWTFQFDAKRGNLVAPTTALAFIKTLNPASGFALTNFLTANMTTIPNIWNTYSISIDITPALVGQLVQFGYANTATLYASSGVLYDNIVWSITATLGVDGKPRANAVELRTAAPNPFARSTRIDYSLAQRGTAEIGIFDIAGRQVATLFSGEAEAGPHSATWDGRTSNGQLAPTGVYECVLNTAAGRQSRRLVLSR